MKKTIIIISLFVLFFWGCIVYTRIQALKTTTVNSTHERLSQVPQKIDVIDIKNLKGDLFDIGYAKFFLPTTNPIPLTSFGSPATWIKGSGNDFNVVFCPPYDAAKEDDNELTIELKKYKIESGPILSISFFEDIESSTPISLFSSFFISRDNFNKKLILLSQKANHYYGYSGVYILATQYMRFMIFSETPQESNTAFVIAENIFGTQSMNMIFHSNETEWVLNNVFSFLKTFEFKTEHLHDEFEIQSLIEKSGISDKKQSEGASEETIRGKADNSK